MISRSNRVTVISRLCIAVMVVLFPLLQGCGVYSFTGASIEGKTINIHVLENRAQNINPALVPTLTGKIRNRILSQTGLASKNTDDADYDITGTIKSYTISVSGVQNTQQATQNRLTIEVEVTFKNRLNEKANFTQAFTRFGDFPATRTLQEVEAGLVDDIGTQLADDIFNKAFVNW